MTIHVSLDLSPDEVTHLILYAEVAGTSRNQDRRSLAEKIREAVDAAHVEPDADEPVYAHDIGGEAGEGS